MKFIILISCGLALIGMSGYFVGGYRSPDWLSPSLLLIGMIVGCMAVLT